MAHPAIKLHGVTKLYRNNRGIDGVDLTVEGGEIFGFLGPNGAGKTTTIRCIMDFIRPSKGTVNVFGHDVRQQGEQLRELIGFLPSDPMLYPKWTGHEHLEFYKKIRGGNTAQDYLDRLNLDVHVPVEHLSTGNKQKLGLILALFGHPKLLILDEPTKGLDPLLQQEIYAILREYTRDGGTVFLSSHNLPEVEKICDRVGVIREGRMVANKSMDDIRAMSIHIVSLTSATVIKKADFVLPNVEIMHASGKHILLKAKGDLNKLLSVASKYNLKDLEVNHANLEDIFLEYYRSAQ